MTSPLLTSATLHRFVRYDARREIMNAVGDLSQIELFGNQTICAPYVQSGLLWSKELGFPIEERLSLERLYELYDSKKGFIAQQLSVESLFQGKVMLVLKIGTEPKIDDLDVGDWVFTLQELTRQLSVQVANSKPSRVLEFVGVKYPPGWPAKLCYDSDFYGRIPDPDMVV